MARRPGRPAEARTGRALTALAVLLAVVVAAPVAAQSPRAGVTTSPLVSGLDAPTALAFLPDGRLVILEKAGAVRLWSPSGGLAPAPLLALPSCTASEMGLLGVAVDPDFANTGHLYLYHTQPPGDLVSRCAEGSGAGRRNRVVRVTMTGDTIAPHSLVVLLDGIRTDNGNHDGGCLRIGPDGLLYVGTGDTGRGDSGGPGSATNPYAQDLGSLEGKILRMTLAGEAPSDNPFRNLGGPADYVWAFGLRNPFRFAFDPLTDLLWVADVGQNTFEEIDIVRAGDNLGWPQCEGRQPRPPCPGDSIAPVHVYGHDGGDASVTGGVFVTGGGLGGALADTYVFADFVLDVVRSATLTPARDGFAAEPAVLLRNAGGPVDFAMGADGALYYVAFQAGAVIRVAGEGDPGVVTPACIAAAGAVARHTVVGAGARLDACVRRGDDGCFAAPQASPVRRPVVGRLARACGSPPSSALCAQLGCVPCTTPAEVAACIAAVATEATATFAARVYDAGTGACERAVSRAAARAARRGLGDQLRCAAGKTKTCGRSTPLRGLGRACRQPSAPLCSALACDPCTGAGELSACGADDVATVADRIASRLALP